MKQYLYNNFLKIGVIHNRNQLENLAAKLPFDENLFLFPSQTIEKNINEKNLQRGTTFEITRRNMLIMEIKKLKNDR